MTNKTAHHFPQETKNIHIIYHYLSVRTGIKKLSHFNHCSQNKVTLGIVKNCPKIYSTCMTKHGRTLVNKSKKFEVDLSYQK
jgi:hypothetical protein